MSRTGQAIPGLIQLPQGHQGIQRVRASLRFENTVLAGRKWRKTSGLGVPIAIDHYLQHGRRVLWTAPVYDQVWEGWTHARDWCGHALVFNQSRMEITHPGINGIIQFRSLKEARTLRSKNTDTLIVDEVQDIDKSDYDSVLIPLMLNSQLPFILKIGTVKAGHWSHRERLDLLDNQTHFTIPAKGYAIVDGELVRAPHPLENNELNDTIVSMLFHSMSEDAFRGEILSEPVSPQGRAFPSFGPNNIRACPYDPMLGDVTAGLDFGFRTLAFTLHQTMTDGTDRTFAEWECHDNTTEEAALRIRRTLESPDGPCPLHALKVIGCDPAGKAVNLQTGIQDVEVFEQVFPHVSMDWYTRNRSPEYRAKRLRSRIRSAAGDIRKYVDPSCKRTIEMYEESKYPLNEDGKPEKDETPYKDHNTHLRDAEGYHEVNVYSDPAIDTGWV